MGQQMKTIFVWTYISGNVHAKMIKHHSSQFVYRQRIKPSTTWTAWFQYMGLLTPEVARQSEMANTSAATCQCLATFTSLKSKMFIFFRDVISLLARVVILLIDTATKRFPWKIKGRGCMAAIFLRFFLAILWAILTAVYEFYMLSVKYWRIFVWRHFSARSSFYCFSW